MTGEPASSFILYPSSFLSPPSPLPPRRARAVADGLEVRVAAKRIEIGFAVDHAAVTGVQGQGLFEVSRAPGGCRRPGSNSKRGCSGSAVLRVGGQCGFQRIDGQVKPAGPLVTPTQCQPRVDILHFHLCHPA